ncbi:CRISPR-associated protein Csx3 [Cyanobacteria bacterium FACHB-DQ100]|nr:CRISPR-associated protein Csx3 [Cyanobacteria bacterium FACHB-DQ100]
MSAIQLEVTSRQTQQGQPYQHLQIQITTADGIINPQDMKALKLPKTMQFHQGVVIEGKAPLWLYGYLVHECHPAPWVGCYDPRLGAIIVATHSHAVAAGQILEIDLPIPS